jgi:hypothetical protein
MHDMGASPYRPRNGIFGERLSPTLGRVPELIEKARPQGYRIGTIEHARQVFEQKTGITTDCVRFEDGED